MWDRLVAFAHGVREGRLTKTQRLVSIAVLMLAEVAVGYFDYANPGLRLAPSAVLFVISIAAIGGAIPGIIAALLAAIFFSLAESRDTLEAFVSHVGLRALSYLLAAGVVLLIRRQASALRQSEMRIHDLELTAARAQVEAAEASFRAVGEAIPFGVWYADARGRLLYMSDSFLQLIGASIGDVRDHWLDRVRPQDAQRIRKAWAGREEWPDLWEDEYVVTALDGRKYSVLCRGSAVRNERGELKGWAGLNLDVTDRTRSREQLRLLADAGRLLSLSLDPGSMLERVAHLVVPRLADWCELHLLREDGEIATPVVTHADPSKSDLARRLAAIERHRDDGGPVAGVIRAAKSLLVEDVKNMAVRGDEKLEVLRAIAPRSVLIVPLRVRGTVFGAMSVVQAESGRTLTEDDVEFFELIAARTALAYENARVYARERRVATTLQRASLPTTLPQVPGIRVKAAYVPGATESEIGGDWYDAFTLADGKLGISTGDVAGKGLRAAIAMSSARQALRAAALEGSGPAEVLRRVNKLLCLENTGMVTAVFGVFDPVTLRLCYAVAGHPAPLVAHAEGDVRALPGGGLPLGLFSDSIYFERSEPLVPGALLTLYTDGLIENERDVVGGEARLRAAVAEEASSATPDPAQSIVGRIIGKKANDDVAVLTVSVSPDPLDRLDLVLDATPVSARVARQSLRRLALAVGLDEVATMDLLVASGEAISNVIEHAYGVEDGDLHLRASREDGQILVEIEDHGSWREARGDIGGRGLTLMRALMNGVKVQRSAHGTTVRLRKSLSEELP